MDEPAPPPPSRPRPAVWPFAVLLTLLLVALGMRLVNLEAYTGKFDEGIRAEQLLLMSEGFRPVRDIFAAQGPLSLDIFYGPYLLFGETLAAARSAVVIYSLLGLLAAFWVGRLVGGRLAGLLAVGLLVLSPLYLKNSRLALLEVPAMVPATVALGAAFLFQCMARRRWLVLSAIMLALALVIKPMVVGVAVPIGLALLLRPKRRVGDFLIFGAVAATVGVLVVALYGPEQVWHQVVGYRGAAQREADWTLRGNWAILNEELRDEQLPIYALALASGLFLAICRPRWGVPLAVWPLVNFALLLFYSPLQFKHVVILLPPLALVIGAAAGALVEDLGTRWAERPLGRGAFGPLSRSPRALVVLGAAALVAWYLAALPAVLRQDWLVMSAATESRVDQYADETRLTAQLTGPNEFVIVDEPIVAFKSRRQVPPWLVDTSSYRVRSGLLSGNEVIDAAERYDVKLAFLFSDGLRDIKKFGEYVDARYRAIKIYERQNAKDRALYLREDADFETARSILERDLVRSPRADFGGDLRLLGYNLGRDELRPGASTSLTLSWEAIRPMAVDYHVITHLRGPNGQHFQSERGLGGGGEGTASWEAGRWVFRSQVLAMPPRAPAGAYQLSVGLYDSKQKSSPLVTAGEGLGSDEVSLGQVRVR